MPEAGNKECIVKCHSCGSKIEVSWYKGFMGLKKGWRTSDGNFFKDGSCPQCHQKMLLKERETILCPHCETLVEKTEDNICLKCGHTLVEAPSRGRIECPECGMKVTVPEKHSDPFVCPICGEHSWSKGELDKYFGPEGQGSKPVDPGPPQYIKLPDVATMEKNGMAIWKHPHNEFSYQSRMQVNEGTIALFLQNGVCKMPCPPGDYLLQNTDLLVTEKLQDAFEGKSRVFKMDIFCVLKDLPEFGWGFMTNPFWNQEGDARFRASANGRISLQVSDAKKYVSFLTFKPVELSELVKVIREVGGGNDGKLIQLVRDEMSSSLYNCLNGRKEAFLEVVVPDEIQGDLIYMLNSRLEQYGLQVKTLWINGLSLKPSEATSKGSFVDYVQSENPWKVADVRLTVPGNAAMYTDVDFDGTFRLRITDQKTLMGTSEAKKLMENQQVSEFTVRDSYTKKVQMILRSVLFEEGQNQVRQGQITNLLDPNQYVSALRERIKERLNTELSLFGLSVDYFFMNIPSEIKASDGLRNALDQPARRKIIRQAVESGLELKTDPVEIHLKDKTSIWQKLVFKGNCRLRIQKDDDFFRMSEVQRFLDSNQPVSETAVREYYIHALTPDFKTVISRIIQGIIDQTNADIREINSFTALILNSVEPAMKQRIEKWGLALESLVIEPPVKTEQSQNFDLLISKEQILTGIKLEEEIQRMQNDHILFGMDEEERIDEHATDLAGKREIHMAETQADVELRKRQLEKGIEIVKLQNGADLDKLADEIRQDKDRRSDEALLEKYKRQFLIREEQINEKIREERMLQEARIDREMAAQKADFDKRLADAENQRALNDLMHKIAESDLTWQQKLDEYDRLRRMTRARDDAEVKKLESDTRIQIMKDMDEAWYHSGSLKLRLSAEQAELMEHLARYAEERKERITAADEARIERRAILDFEQRMQDRREYIAQQMDLIAQRYNQELAMRDKEVDLEKLKAQLQYAAFQAGESTKLGIAQTRAEAAARVAEARAAIKRAEDQLKREESLEKQATDFKNQLLEIQKVLELTRLEIERNRDNKLAEVAIETAKANAEGGAGSGKGSPVPSNEYEQLDKKLQTMINSVNGLRGKINALKHQVDILTLKIGAGYVPAGSGSPGTPGTGRGTGSGSGSSDMMECPICKRLIPRGSMLCPHCQNLIIN